MRAKSHNNQMVLVLNYFECITIKHNLLNSSNVFDKHFNFFKCVIFVDSKKSTNTCCAECIRFECAHEHTAVK